MQQAAQDFNPVMPSAGPAGIAETHRYDFMRHAHEPAHQMSHHAPPPVNKPTSLGLGTPPALMAPALPADVLADMRNPNKQQQFRKHIHQAGQDVERMNEIERLSDAIHDRENPFTRRHRRSILLTWSLIMAQKYPHLEPGDHWTTEVVLKEAKFYLRWRVSFPHLAGLLIVVSPLHTDGCHPWPPWCPPHQSSNITKLDDALGSLHRQMVP
jgi:hypothetical protein